VLAEVVVLGSKLRELAEVLFTETQLALHRDRLLQLLLALAGLAQTCLAARKLAARRLLAHQLTQRAGMAQEQTMAM